MELRSSPAAHLLLCVPAPDRPRTGTVPRPGGWDPWSRQREVELRDGSGIYGAKGGAEWAGAGDLRVRASPAKHRDDQCDQCTGGELRESKARSQQHVAQDGADQSYSIHKSLSFKKIKELSI